MSLVDNPETIKQIIKNSLDSIYVSKSSVLIVLIEQLIKLELIYNRINSLERYVEYELKIKREREKKIENLIRTDIEKNLYSKFKKDVVNFDKIIEDVTYSYQYSVYNINKYIKEQINNKKLRNPINRRYKPRYHHNP